MLFLSRTLPMLIAFVFGILGIAIYYIPHGVAQEMEREFSLWLRIVAAFAYFVGLYSLMNLHWGRIRRRNPGWGYSLVVYLGFGLMFIFVMYNAGEGPFGPLADAGGYRWMFRIWKRRRKPR